MSADENVPQNTEPTLLDEVLRLHAQGLPPPAIARAVGRGLTEDHVTVIVRLADASTTKAEAAVRVKEEAVRTSVDLLDAQACARKVTAIEEAINTAVLAMRPADVLRLGDEKRVAEVDADIATRKASRSAAKHAASVDELRQAEKAFAACAQQVKYERLIAMAHEFTAALDAAHALGKQLQAEAAFDPYNRPMNRPVPTLPGAVMRALERLPQPHWINTPLNVLRGENARFQQ